MSAPGRTSFLPAWRADVSGVWHKAVLRLVVIALVAALGGAEATPLGESSGDGVVDRGQTLQGLRARIGDEVDRWTVEIEERSGTTVFVRVSGEGTASERTLELRGDTSEERSRELATALAFWIDELAVEGEGDDPSGTSETSSLGGDTHLVLKPEPEPKPQVRLWLTVGPRVGVGRPARSDFDVGADVFGGVELLRGHLQPLLLVGVTGASKADLQVTYMHLGAGLAAGTGLLRERLWVGGGVVPRAIWLRLQEGERRQQAWNAAGSVLAIGHYRIPLKDRFELQLSLRVGADLTLPELLLTGSSARLARGNVRTVMAGSLGFRW